MQGTVSVVPRLGEIVRQIGKNAADKRFLMSGFAQKSVEISALGDWAIDPAYQGATAQWFSPLGSRQGVFFPMLARQLVSIVPLHARIAIAAGYLPGSVRGEGLPTVLQRMQFTADDLEPQTAIGMAGVSRETVDAVGQNGVQILEDAASLGVIYSVDSAVHDEITQSAYTQAPASGTSSADLYKDARAALLGVFEPGQPTGRAFWVCSPATAIALSTLPTTGGQLACPDMTPNGGSLLGLIVLVSPAWGEELTLIDGGQAAAGAQGLAVDASMAASYDASLSPGMNAALGSNPANLISAFQSSVILYRTVTRFVFALARTTAAFSIVGASGYGS